MTLAIFDLDNTLLGGDSDYLWGTFLAEKGLVDQATYDRKNKHFFKQYEEGTLDIQEYLSFALAILAEHDRSTLDGWHREFMQRKVMPIIHDKGRELLAKHRAQGHTLIIITATNRFLTQPVALELGVDALLATEAEQNPDGTYTGHSCDIPCFKEGKVTRLERWMKENLADLEGSWFYSDSLNDIPLLSRVDHPVAVDPDPTLQAEAEKQGWPVISLRSDDAEAACA
uniref:Histidinol-phosphatase n=1 Tax=Magnetococcus massalia (strain MO-1) TaxID=451514 RepID=A0A1S7LF62_MAGMO|nr:putative HAD-superfamily hydrolase [Candidatus Magnetococcus massalia]